MKMYLPIPAPQRSVLKAAFLYGHEILHADGDFLNVSYRCPLTRLISINKRKELSVTEKVICFMYINKSSYYAVSSKSSNPWSISKNPEVAHSIFHEMNFTWLALYWPPAQLLNSALYSLCHAFLTYL